MACVFSNLTLTSSDIFDINVPPPVRTPNVLQAFFVNSHLDFVPFEVLFTRFAFLWRILVSNTGLKVLNRNTYPTNMLANFLAENNFVERIEADAFALMPKLEMISMKNNSINFIDGNAFKSNPNVFLLDFSYNKLEFLPSEIFSGMQYLQIIRLSNNPITVFDAYLFNPAPSLQHVDCRNCKLWAISDTAFALNENLTSIFLAGNICINKDFFSKKEIKENYADFKLCFDNFVPPSVDPVDPDSNNLLANIFVQLTLIASVAIVFGMVIGSALIHYRQREIYILERNYHDSFDSDCQDNIMDLDTSPPAAENDPRKSSDQENLLNTVHTSYETTIRNSDNSRKKYNFRVLGPLKQGFQKF